MLRYVRCAMNESINKCTGAFIFLHGSGGTGEDLQGDINYISNGVFSFPHVKVIFPTAPLMPYTLGGGYPVNVWFDRVSLDPDGSECLSSIDAMAEQLKNIVEAEVSSGIPRNRIVVGGFSMGASMALHLGLRHLPDIAGIVSLSTFLYNNSEVYKKLEAKDQIPPVLFCHGDGDELIDFKWGQNMYKRLTQLGVVGNFHKMTNLDHSINATELRLVRSWVTERIPLID